MLKVLVDARKIEHGGIGTYLRNLISGLLAAQQVQPLLIMPPGSKGRYFSDQLAEQFEDSARTYSVDEYLFFGRRLRRRFSFDLFHSPHFTLPFGLSSPAVVTVHDTIHLTQPEKWFYPLIGKALMGSALKRANKVISVSSASRQEILSHFPEIGNLASKIEVVSNAISAGFLRQSSDMEISSGLEPGFIFGLFSQFKPHKGLLDLLQAYCEASEHLILPQLVIAGQGVKKFRTDCPDRLTQLKKYPVVLFDQIDPEKLKLLYRLARVTVLPSTIEGFGLTALEAKVTGCPLLIRPLPSVMEFVDDRDRICKDMSVASLREELLAVYQNFPQSCSKELNLELADKYSIATLAKETFRVYQQALE